MKVRGCFGGVALMLVAVLFGGCIYSMEVLPQYSASMGRSASPINATFGLRSITVHFMQKEICFNKNEWAEAQVAFRDTVGTSGTIHAVAEQVPADLYLEVWKHPDVTGELSLERTFYRDFMTISLLGFVTPLPYPFYLTLDGQARITAEMDGRWFVLREYPVHFQLNISSASIWGARYKRTKIQDRIIRYVMPIVLERMKNESVFFDAYASAAHASADAKRKFLEQNGVPR